jgi:hypothetical protein
LGNGPTVNFSNCLDGVADLVRLTFAGLEKQEVIDVVRESQAFARQQRRVWQ